MFVFIIINDHINSSINYVLWMQIARNFKEAGKITSEIKNFEEKATILDTNINDLQETIGSTAQSIAQLKDSLAKHETQLKEVKEQLGTVLFFF